MTLHGALGDRGTARKQVGERGEIVVAGTMKLFCHACLTPLESKPEVGRGGELVDLVRPCPTCLRRRGVQRVPEGFQLVPIPRPRTCEHPGCEVVLRSSGRGWRKVRWCEPHKAERQRAKASEVNARQRAKRPRRTCRTCEAPIAHTSRRQYCDECHPKRAPKRCRDCGATVPAGKHFCDEHRAIRQRERQSAYRRKVGKGGHNGARPKWDGLTLRCVVCDAELPRGRGRPRSYCDDHRTYRLSEDAA